MFASCEHPTKKSLICFSDEEKFLVPLVLIRSQDGLEIKNKFTYEKGYLAFIGDNPPIVISTLPIIVVIIVGVLVVLVGLCICGALVRMLLNLNKK